MKRREFVLGSARVMGAAWLVSRGLGRMMQALPALPRKFNAYETVTLGRTGIQTSLLAMGTGTVGSGHHSNQTALGMKGLPDLLLNGYDHGLRFFDSADSYGSHPHVAEALKRVPRDKVTVLTKTWARDANSARADLDRFRKELGTDYLDVCLMHCLQKGIIRAHGCSCHSIEALRAAAKSPWVEVDLVRINPIGSHMDADPDTVVSVLHEMKTSGKAIVGMKILGQGDLRTRPDEALKYALSLGVLDAFTIGAENKTEQEGLIRRIALAA
ncbi:MAG: aldo/keto reductase [Acidobacteria bacterium]|nr:MAG: aldo/keto reductase [Acidobacteriota bacterium]